MIGNKAVEGIHVQVFVRTSRFISLGSAGSQGRCYV